MAKCTIHNPNAGTLCDFERELKDAGILYDRHPLLGQGNGVTLTFNGDAYEANAKLIASNYDLNIEWK